MNSSKKFHPPSQVEKVLNVLRGCLVGVSADGHFDRTEAAVIRKWLDSSADLVCRPPFSEVASRLERGLENGVIAPDEVEELRWFLDRCQPGDPAFSDLSRGVQELRGILIGITADGRITEAELRSLRNWLDDHDELRATWPYDEIDALVTSVLADGRIDPDEHRQLMAYFTEYAQDGALPPASLPLDEAITRGGICACDPEIVLEGRRFCMAGDSRRGPRSVVEGIIEDAGGIVLPGVRDDLNYLVVGSEGSPCWKVSCYGAKVEAVMTLRRGGRPILIVHENDLWDTLG